MVNPRPWKMYTTMGQMASTTNSESLMLSKRKTPNQCLGRTKISRFLMMKYGDRHHGFDHIPMNQVMMRTWMVAIQWPCTQCPS